LDELGADLRRTTPGQRRLTLARPYVGIAVFAVGAWLGWWWLTPLVVFGIFVAIVTATHDVVHRTLGLTERQTSIGGRCDGQTGAAGAGSSPRGVRRSSPSRAASCSGTSRRPC
jgi:hypothetical protein